MGLTVSLVHPVSMTDLASRSLYPHSHFLLIWYVILNIKVQVHLFIIMGKRGIMLCGMQVFSGRNVAVHSTPMDISGGFTTLDTMTDLLENDIPEDSDSVSIISIFPILLQVAVINK